MASGARFVLAAWFTLSADHAVPDPLLAPTTGGDRAVEPSRIAPCCLCIRDPSVTGVYESVILPSQACMRV